MCTIRYSIGVSLGPDALLFGGVKLRLVSALRRKASRPRGDTGPLIEAMAEDMQSAWMGMSRWSHTFMERNPW